MCRGVLKRVVWQMRTLQFKLLRVFIKLATSAILLAGLPASLVLLSLRQTCARQFYPPSSPSNAWASWRSAVSNPSVNQP
jgi:hypothetical protein